MYGIIGKTIGLSEWSLPPKLYSTMCGTRLKTTENIPDRVLTINKRLLWTEHVKNIVSKANTRLWLCITRSLGFKNNVKPK